MTEEKKFYTATNEAVFYYCIGQDLNKAKIFIEQVIKKNIISIQLKNAKLLKDYMNTKERTLDYLVLTDIGYINIEINNYNQKWRIDRDITYACKILTNSIDKTDGYTNIKKVIQINLSRLGKTENEYGIYRLNIDKYYKGYPKTLTDIMEIYLVNIDFYKDMVYNGNKKFIKDNYLICAIDLNLEDIDRISEGNDELMGFKELLEKINDDKDFVKWMSAEEEAQMIHNTLISIAKEEGIAKGIEQEKIEIAKNFLKTNVPIDIIASGTGLSVTEIEELK